MVLLHNTSLLQYNTFGIDVPAEYLAEVSCSDDINEAIKSGHALHILGGGSNILLTAPVSGLVLVNKLSGIAVLEENEATVRLRVASGEVWHELVLFAIERGWGGIENMALIPGTAGAAPIQNIGAYGIELKYVLESVTFTDLADGSQTTLSAADCRFGYRDSIFKNELKGKVFINDIVIRLSKQPEFNISYGAIRQELDAMGISELSVRAVAQAVINIRSSKLPDPKQTGNAGSFFKNPTIGLSDFEKLAAQYPSIPSYPAGDEVKIPAGWLIEKCGWKGYRRGDAGVHNRQALVLVNLGKASGGELWHLSADIVISVADRFGIELEREVQVW